MKKGFEIIHEGFAKARFGALFSGGVIPGMAGADSAKADLAATAGRLNLAAVENNGGLNPEEYFVTNCRLLSAACTPYRKIDFSREGVLKAAVPLFEGLTLYANHDADVNDWKGLIQAPVWDGENTPNGINAKAIIDRTVDPKLARGVETKALRSFSVTIWFSYEKSHPDLANFYDRLGETIDGEMVRLIVTNISNAGEVSVVWEGEDPYAKSFEAGDGGQGLGTGENLNNNEEDQNMKITETTMCLLSIPAGTDVTEEMLEAKLNETVTGLKTQVESLAANAAIGVQTLTETRERAVTLYKAAKGEKAVETFIATVIEKADLATARAFCQEYQLAVDESIPLKCGKCGEPLSRRSSQEQDPAGPANGKRPEDFKL